MFGFDVLGGEAVARPVSYPKGDAMQVFVAHFKDSPIRYIETSDHGVLINTKDYCRAAGLTERPSGHALAKPCLDIVSAVMCAGDVDLAMWLNETFAEYNPATNVYPACDDDWNFA
jgi:hypothetical protein